MKTRILGICLLMLSLAAGSIHAATLAVGDKVHLNCTTTTGLSITNRMLKGHLLVVEFWASWCPHCIRHAPDVVKDYKEFSKQGVGFLGVSTDSDLGAMQQAARAIGYVWPQVCDGLTGSDPMATSWGVKGIPDAFIIGPTGTVLWTGYPTRLAAALRAQLKKHPTQAIFANHAAKILSAATQMLEQKHDLAGAIAGVAKISPKIGRDASLIGPAKQFLFAVRRSGPKAVEQLRRNTAAMQSLSAIIGRGNVLTYLGL